MPRNATHKNLMMEQWRNIVTLVALSVQITSCVHIHTPLNGLMKSNVMSTVPLTVEFSVMTGNVFMKT